MTVAAGDHAERAYDLFAPFYDAFTAEHRYDEWTASLETLARRAGLRGKRLLDVACGTGKSFAPFAARGYDVTACDVSAAMLHEARARAGDAVRLERHDMRELPVLGEFDLVTCLDDAVNYLHSEAELEATFAGLRRNLAPAGVVVFDTNTLATFRVLYSSLLVVPGERIVLVLEGLGSECVERGGRSDARLDALVRGDDGWWSRTSSLHRHRHHDEATIRRALDRAGLECVAAYGQHIDGSVDPEVDDMRHSKAVYIARVRAQNPGGRR